MEVVRKKLSAGELYNPHLTYDSMTDEVLYDDIAAPNLDPRHNGSIPLPASGTLQCDSAATMVALLRLMTEQMIDNINAGATATQITSAFLALLVVLGWISLFIAIIVALVAAALTAGGAALEAAFVQSTWDDLLCILYCFIDADGQLDAADLSLIRAQVDAQLPALAALILNYYFDTLGEAGLNNASVALGGLETGDCAACECEWCYEWTDFSAGWTIIQGALGGAGGLDATLLADPPSYYNYLSAYYHMPNEEVNLRGIEIEFVRVDGTMDAPTPIDRMWRISDTPPNRFEQIEAPSNFSPFVSDTAFDAGNTDFGFTMSAGYGNGAPPGGSLHVSLVRFTGLGALPAFTGGTDCS